MTGAKIGFDGWNARKKFSTGLRTLADERGVLGVDIGFSIEAVLVSGEKAAILTEQI